MPRHPGLPKPSPTQIVKADLLQSLRQLDQDRQAIDRILLLESEFRQKIKLHVSSLPTKDALLEKFNTNPFVLMIYCLHREYGKISQIEKDILSAKLFSSMETSAGRMIETTMLPAYGWEIVPSEMHTLNSALDGKKIDGDTIKLATLKSGPRILNDSMSEYFADAIIDNVVAWALEAQVSNVDFTYGVLYGTKKQSNKKDWHILRNISEKLPPDSIILSPDGRWECEFRISQVQVRVSVRIGVDWWTYLGGDQCFLELCIALIRACVKLDDIDPIDYEYNISDLRQIASIENISPSYNVSILQRSQLPWLFFLARHFADTIIENE